MMKTLGRYAEHGLGLSVIASDMHGIHNLIKYGITGVLVYTKDPAPMTKAMSFLMDNPDKRIALADAGRQYAKKISPTENGECLPVIILKF
ncbi:MAG: hypothetical protein ABIT07_04345 [Ferruginibacter sp.]